MLIELAVCLQFWLLEPTIMTSSFYVQQQFWDCCLKTSEMWRVDINVAFSFRCYSFAEMPWYQRKIAATLFATPPTSTFQEVQCENISQIIPPTKLMIHFVLIFLTKTDLWLCSRHGVVSLQLSIYKMGTWEWEVSKNIKTFNFLQL